jgi:hypothetical protein
VKLFITLILSVLAVLDHDSGCRLESARNSQERGATAGSQKEKAIVSGLTVLPNEAFNFGADLFQHLFHLCAMAIPSFLPDSAEQPKRDSQEWHEDIFVPFGTVNNFGSPLFGVGTGQEKEETPKKL